MGINTSLSHEGREYHIQCEDLGEKQACLEIKVYDAGNILWQKRIPYKEGAASADAVRDQMEKLVKTVQAAIVQGKIR